MGKQRLFLPSFCLLFLAWQTAAFTSLFCSPPLTTQLYNNKDREQEIKRKIRQLKRQGKIAKLNQDNSASSPSYDAKIRQKLGASKSNILGFGVDEDEDVISSIEKDLEDRDDDEETAKLSSRARLGALPVVEEPAEVAKVQQRDFPAETRTQSTSIQKRIIDPSLFPEVKSEEPEMSEEELLELVAEKLAENKQGEVRIQFAKAETVSTASSATTSPSKSTSEQTISGVGGTWEKKEDDTEEKDLYKPKSGSWGAFPRPRNISTAYGGGRRVGAGYSKEDDMSSELRTQNLLKEYRQKVGIDGEYAKAENEALRSLSCNRLSRTGCHT